MGNTIADKIPGLSDQQTKLLRLIATWRRPEMPSLSNLATAMNYSDASAVRYQMDILISGGLIQRGDIGVGVYKHPKLTGKGQELFRRHKQSVPYFTGGLHAGGFGIQPDEEVQRVQELADLYPLWNEEYFCDIVGDCMDGGMEPIRSGDVLLMQPIGYFDRPQNGSVVHVELPLGNGQNEPLLREYYIDEENGLVTLKCYNPELGSEQEQTYQEFEVEVRGVLVSIKRDFPVNIRRKDMRERDSERSRS